MTSPASERSGIRGGPGTSSSRFDSALAVDDRLEAYVSEHMARRLGAAVAAVRTGGTRYLEAG
jgi:hypothetical protein